jgi:MFS transporter, OPA family, glycerol-3-phosphate transporter
MALLPSKATANDAVAGPGQADSAAPSPPSTSVSTIRASVQLGCIILGYIGIYLCRKNLEVAVPLLQQSFHVDKADIGALVSYSTMAYMVGKLFWGPVLIDRIGGRICFFAALLGVALFGGLSGFAGSLPVLGLLYSLNRFCGSGGWGSMVKLVPEWFPPRHLALAMAFLSLSFVFGGICALLLAGQIAAFTHNSWRAVMGFPSILLLVIIGVCWLILSSGRTARRAATTSAAAKSEWRFSRILELAKVPQFWIVCALSFILTITRETFNVWTVDFLRTEAGGHLSSQIAALLSTPFDAMGAVGILLLGWVLDRLSGNRRNWLLFSILAGCGGLVFVLPHLAKLHLWLAVTAIGVIGFLSYGPYSLLAGVLSVEIKGKAFVATVAGLVDASGYLAGIVSGYVFGRILDRGGYRLGFHCLGAVTLAAGLLCLGLYSRRHLAATESTAP